MENNIDKQNWINGVINSTSAMNRATPKSDIYDHVMARVIANEKITAPLPARRWIAAAIMLLAFNIGTIAYVLEQNKKPSNTIISGTLLTETQSATTYNY